LIDCRESCPADDTMCRVAGWLDISHTIHEYKYNEYYITTSLKYFSFLVVSSRRLLRSSPPSLYPAQYLLIHPPCFPARAAMRNKTGPARCLLLGVSNIRLLRPAVPCRCMYYIAVVSSQPAVLAACRGTACRGIY